MLVMLFKGCSVQPGAYPCWLLCGVSKGISELDYRVVVGGDDVGCLEQF